MKTLIATITTLAIIALAIPAMAAEKPYQPKNKKEEAAYYKFLYFDQIVANSDSYKELVKARAEWNAIVKAGMKGRDFKKATEGEE